MYVISNAAVRHFGLPGIDHQTLAGAGNGLNRLSVWRQSVEPQGATPPHRHDCEEVVLVTAGRGELRVGDEVHAFGPDCTVVIPANVAHQIVNVGDEPLQLIAALSVSEVKVELPDGEPIALPWD